MYYTENWTSSRKILKAVGRKVVEKPTETPLHFNWKLCRIKFDFDFFRRKYTLIGKKLAESKKFLIEVFILN